MKMDSDVLKVIRSTTVDGLTLRLQGTLDRKLYDRVNLALQAVGGTWNRYQRAHIFPFTAADALAGLLATGEVITDVDRGYFPTPKPLVEQLLDLAELEAGCEVLEPSAGRGAIAEAAAARGAVVDCIELDTTRAEHIRAGGYAREVAAADFFNVKVQRRYQRVVMNPPFADGRTSATSSGRCASSSRAAWSWPSCTAASPTGATVRPRTSGHGFARREGLSRNCPTTHSRSACPRWLPSSRSESPPRPLGSTPRRPGLRTSLQSPQRPSRGCSSPTRRQPTAQCPSTGSSTGPHHG
ncbi:hypothetical protein STRTUCAR8_03701 [Streptomyces turgidiscabies Car8]|uniref:Methyltransferase small domain-containing protein n=1 Tax=Streptomyces turgidiscabies (strain Car8) TaxID=698760 RepID=L7FGM6_STRT8|nr:hypothetical protein STRTUCAR8_03701 [Streptomyces turgidiscabies Car8]GAQ68666.1 hypothetical protein T45_00378 [Streptomyces turgidiscabies]